MSIFPRLKRQNHIHRLQLICSVCKEIINLVNTKIGPAISIIIIRKHNHKTHNTIYRIYLPIPRVTFPTRYYHIICTITVAIQLQ